MLLALGVGSSSLEALGESQRLPGALEVAGRWRITSNDPSGASCAFELQEKDRAVSDPQACLQPILGFIATSWQVQPDGIVLAGDGLAMPMLFSRREAGRYSARAKEGTRWWLERAGH
jgi:hypothetical protein